MSYDGMTRKIPAWAFLALGSAAEANGGVGCKRLFSFTERGLVPVCAFGLAADADGLTEEEASAYAYDRRTGPVNGKPAELSRALVEAGVTWGVNDDVVRAWRREQGNWSDEGRVPFDVWAEQMGLEPIVDGEGA